MQVIKGFARVLFFRRYLVMYTAFVMSFLLGISNAIVRTRKFDNETFYFMKLSLTFFSHFRMCDIIFRIYLH